MKHTTPQVFDCFAFGELARVAYEHLRQGQSVVIAGTLASSPANAAPVIHVGDCQEKGAVAEDGLGSIEELTLQWGIEY